MIPGHFYLSRLFSKKGRYFSYKLSSCLFFLLFISLSLPAQRLQIENLKKNILVNIYYTQKDNGGPWTRFSWYLEYNGPYEKLKTSKLFPNKWREHFLKLLVGDKVQNFVFSAFDKEVES